jgi:hypothetical protein
MNIEISDNDGIIGIVNTYEYNSFVDEDWQLEQLKNHFIQEMNNQNLIVWQANNLGGGKWNIEVVQENSKNNCHSEFSKTIKVSNGMLNIVNYTDLTMAAQFQDEKLPSKQNASKAIFLENGWYNLTIRRMFNPDTEIDETKTSFEIVTKKITETEKSDTEKIFWWTFQ